MSKVKITVLRQEGKCVFGHKAGDTFLYGEGEPIPRVCPGAWAVFYRHLYGLLYGANYPWEKEGEAHVACPDPFNPITFKLERVEGGE